MRTATLKETREGKANARKFAREGGFAPIEDAPRVTATTFGQNYTPSLVKFLAIGAFTHGTMLFV